MVNPSFFIDAVVSLKVSITLREVARLVDVARHAGVSVSTEGRRGVDCSVEWLRTR